MNKEQQAIARLRLAAEMSETYYHAPLVITTSGGKDSDVCLALARAAGIRYEVQHNHTSVDAPETVYHVRETFHRLENEGIKCTVNLPTYKGALRDNVEFDTAKTHAADARCTILLFGSQRAGRQRSHDNNRCPLGRKRQAPQEPRYLRKTIRRHKPQNHD